MDEQERQHHTIDEPRVAQLRHTLKASKLLYSAPGYILRAPIHLVSIILLVGFVYSFWAKKDELVVAPLKLERESYTIQAVGSGLVSDIRTEENALISAGDLVAVIQEQIRIAAKPEQQALISKRWEFQQELDKARKDYDHQISQLELDLEDLRRGRVTEMAGLDAQIGQIRVQLQTAERAMDSARRRLALARKRLGTKQALFKSKDITITEYEEAQEAVSELDRSVNDSDAEIQKIRLSLQTAEQERSKLESLHREDKLVRDIEKARANRERDVKELSDRIASITSRLAGADALVPGVDYAEDNTARYKSKYDGLVTSIHVKRSQLVDAGSPLATIVKNSSALVGRVLVSNQDIGRVKHGQDVKIKYFAYPYQDFGIQSGTIVDIATDPGGDNATESQYVVKVALYKEAIAKKGGRLKNLEIGLEGVAEIKTGEKRLIELLFAPVSKFFVDPEE